MRSGLNTSKYKSLPRIRADVWGNALTKHFTRKKWRGFISTLKHKQRKKRKNTHVYLADIFIESLPKFPVYHRYIFQNNLFLSIRIRLFYGRLQDYKLKRICITGKGQSYIDFVRNIEIKPPIFLYRAKFLYSYVEGISHQRQKHILIDGNPNKKVVRVGEVLHFTPTYISFLRRRLEFKRKINSYRVYLHHQFVLNKKPVPQPPFTETLEEVANEKNKVVNRFAALKRLKKTFRKKRAFDLGIKNADTKFLKIDFVINEAFDFDVRSFRFFFFNNIPYFKNHPFQLPYARLKLWYTRT